MKTEFKDVIGFERYYKISNDGTLWSKRREKLMKPRNLEGYNRFLLTSGDDRKEWLAHRLVAEHFMENWDPKKLIDHINGNKRDNRISNLRLVDFSENRRGYLTKKKGLTSLYRGVSWSKKSDKWTAQIRDVKVVNLGVFNTEIEAAMAYNDAANRANYFPESLNNLDIE